MRHKLELVSFFLGGALLFFVVRHFGFASTLQTLFRAGPASFLVFLFYPVMSLWDVVAWRFCFPQRLAAQARWRELFWIRLAGEAVNNITPFIDIGGEPLKIHLLSKRLGIPVSSATSSTVVARTSLLLSEAFFLMFGVLLSYELIPMPTQARWQMTGALLAVCVAFVAFLAAQQREWLKRINPEIPRYYSAERARFWIAVPLNWMGWIFGGIETYFLCRLIGIDVSILEAVMLEALLQLVRTASFFIPGNLGVQEGGMALFMGQMGFEPVVGVGISLLKRFRQILWTSAGFLVWAVFQYKDAKTREVVVRDKALLSFDTWLDKHIHRPPAELLSFFLSKTAVTPNQVTLCSLVPAVLSGAFFAMGSFSFAVMGTIFFYLWSLLDHADGSLARRKRLFSKWGQLLDDTCDNVASGVIFFGIFTGLVRLWNAHDRAILWPVFFTIFLLNILAMLLVTHAKRKQRLQAVRRSVTSEGFLWKQRLLDSLMGRDAFYVLIGLVLAAAHFGPACWPLLSFTMGFFIISMAVVSTVALIEYFRSR